MTPTLVVATSTSGLDMYTRPHGIRMLRLHLQMGKRSYLDGKVPVTDLYNWMLSDPANLAKTSPPTQNELMLFFQGIQREGYKNVLVLTLTSKLSQTYAMVQRMVKIFAGRLNIHLFDTRALAHGEAVYALEAERCLQNGWDIQAVIRRLELLREHVTQFFTVGSLDYMIRNGTLSPVSGFIGNLLELRPVLQLAAGEIRLLSRVRKTQRAVEALVDAAVEYVGNARSEFVVMEAGVASTNEALWQVLRHKYRYHRLPRQYISPVIAAHTGADGVALLVVRRPPSLQHYRQHVQ